jgi:hypothetical protein
VSFSIHPAACAELNAAVDYYEEAEPGLGYEFLEEVYATIHRAIAHPTSMAADVSPNAPMPDTTLPLQRDLPGPA